MSSTVLLEFPVSVVEWTHLPRLQPSRNAMEMEGMVADPPGDRALFSGGSTLVCLTFDAQVHDVVPADGAVVDHDIPSPQCHCIPLQSVSIPLGPWV